MKKSIYNKYLQLALLGVFFTFLVASDVTLSIGNVDEQNGSFDILYDTQQSIHGFQLEVLGVSFLDVTSDHFEIEHGAGTILGYSMSEDAVISIGQGTLAHVTYQLSSDVSSICIDSATISGGSFPAVELSSSTGDCHAVDLSIPITISFGESDAENRTLEINYASSVNMQGFQLDVTGVDIDENPSSEFFEIHNSFGFLTILGIDMDGIGINPGVGGLMTVSFQDELGEVDLCIENAIFTSGNFAVGHQFANGENCTFISAQSYDCEGVANGDSVLDECGECGGNGSTCADACGVPNGDDTSCMDECGVPNGDDTSCMDECGVINGDGYYQGDLNFDCDINVTDVIVLVDIIMPGGDEHSEEEFASADVNEDGDINILDVVALTHVILSGDGLARGQSATKFILYHGIGVMEFEADGNIAGIQLEVSGNHEIIGHDLPAGWLMHHGEGTILLHAMDGSSLQEKTLFTYSGELHVKSIIVADWHGSSIDVSVVSLPDNYILSPAYPNPFNPTTTLDLTLLVKEKVSVQVYNMQGQQVASLHNGEMEAGNHSLTWNADSHGSGIYFVKMLAGEHQSIQKITLIK